ncbi:hypothetical protein SAMN06265173_11245 [Thalassovita litoralis]|uniref:DUF6900 domain-containing protein n=1 Tax=Thalassovita litoralis TaxID=1010611 RepID=A0A521DQS6_9RHOB|nr:hypothetical protein [Thalassovita litoralis]SMO73952.1 hypothetical protein SAMN06265173_11245 [Thalassovita litoralis]
MTQQQLTTIAQRHTGFDTLETQNSDHLDFGDIAVWQLEAALKDAYDLGRQKAETNSMAGLYEQAADLMAAMAGEIEAAADAARNGEANLAIGTAVPCEEGIQRVLKLIQAAALLRPKV